MTTLQNFVCAVLCIAAAPAQGGTRPGLGSVGALSCRISQGSSIGLGDDRGLVCLFERPGLTMERYEGTTGIVTAPVSPLGAAQSVTYAVTMPDPEALAALAGDYDGRGFGSSGGSAALVGGTTGTIVLRPLDNRATTALAPLNDVLGLSQLHLNYAGRVPAAMRSPLRRGGSR